jgi:hypothetical protein
MSEVLRPRNIVCAGMIGAAAIWGGGQVAEYYGQRAGEAAREEIEEIDIANEQWNELKALLADEDLRDLLVQNLRDDGIDDPMDIIEALDD